MRAMVLDRPGDAAPGGGACRGRDAGAGPGAPARPGVRRLPHRPAHRRRRARPPEAPAGRPATRSSARPRTGAGSASRGSAGRAAAAATARAAARTSATRARFTGYDLDGGYAEWVVADERFCFPLPDGYGDLEAAPLLCAGLIGYRALRLAGDGERLGLYGFGAAAHIVAQVALWEGRRVFAVTREGDERRAGVRALARRRVGRRRRRRPRSSTRRSSSRPPASSCPPPWRGREGRHASSAPASTCPTSRPSRTSILWGERSLRSVANLTRRDGEEFLALAPRVPVRTTVEAFALEDANEALAKLRAGDVEGALVIVP